MVNASWKWHSPTAKSRSTTFERIHILGDDFSAEQVLFPIHLLVPPIPKFMATGDHAHTTVFDRLIRPPPATS